MAISSQRKQKKDERKHSLYSNTNINQNFRKFSDLNVPSDLRSSHEVIAVLKELERDFVKVK